MADFGLGGGKQFFGIKGYVEGEPVGDVYLISENLSGVTLCFQCFGAVSVCKGFGAVRNRLAEFLREFEAAFLDDVGDGVDVVAEGAAAEAGGFERDGATTGEGVEDAGHLVEEGFDGIVEGGFFFLYCGRGDVAVWGGVEGGFDGFDSGVVGIEVGEQPHPLRGGGLHGGVFFGIRATLGSIVGYPDEFSGFVEGGFVVFYCPT